MNRRTSIRSKILTNIAKAIADKKGTNTVAIQVGKLENSMIDFLLICEVSNIRQAGAVVDHIVESLAQRCHRKPLFMDGKANSSWMVLDYEDVIVHVMTKECRNFYQLEELWTDVPLHKLEP